MRIRQIKPNEVSLYKELRLRALADAPDAFGQSLAEVSAQPQEQWVSTVEAFAKGCRKVAFFALEARRGVGLVFAFVDKERQHIGHVCALWVDPSARGKGVGQGLLDAVKAWARKTGLNELELWVTQGNSCAARLYEKAGFCKTGRNAAHPVNPTLQADEMKLKLEDC